MEVRDDRPRGYCQVRNVIVDEYLVRIGPHACAVYLALLRHTDNDGVCWPSLARLATLTGIARSTVQQAIKTLQDHGLIAIEARKATDSNAPVSNLCHILPIPGDGIGIPQDGTPYTAGRHTLYRDTVHPIPPHGNEQDSMNKTHLTRPIEGGEDARKRAARAPFVKPTLDELRTQFAEKGCDPEEASAFYDHYETVGWRVGRAPGKPMVCWQSAVGLWLKHKKDFDAERIQHKRNGHAPASDPTSRAMQRYDAIMAAKAAKGTA